MRLTRAALCLLFAESVNRLDQRFQNLPGCHSGKRLIRLLETIVIRFQFLPGQCPRAICDQLLAAVEV